LGDWEHDVVRRSKLAALGWLVIHVSWHMLVHEPDEVERLIRGAIGQPSLL
jgi:very-short-patch-repair endonuclease